MARIAGVRPGGSCHIDAERGERPEGARAHGGHHAGGHPLDRGVGRRRARSNQCASHPPGSSGMKNCRRVGTRPLLADHMNPWLKGRPFTVAGRAPTTCATCSSSSRPSHASLRHSTAAHRAASQRSASHTGSTSANSGSSTSSEPSSAVWRQSAAHASARAVGAWGNSQTVTRAWALTRSARAHWARGRASAPVVRRTPRTTRRGCARWQCDTDPGRACRSRAACAALHRCTGCASSAQRR